MQAVGFIGNRASGVLLFFSFFSFSLRMMSALGIGSEGVFFLGSTHYTWKLQSFAFCYKATLHENTTISLYPST